MNHSFENYNHRRKNHNLGRDNFWSRHSLVVAIDASEILDRVFCNCGLVALFQEAFTLTALDKRSYAPPIESNGDRLVNMANTCESFRISAKSVAKLAYKGFKSVTLLSLANSAILYPDTPDQEKDLPGFRKCLKTLNDRRQTVLEPLHSLRRLAQAKRKHLHNISKDPEYLDLARPRSPKLPKNFDFKQPQPMIAKTTFNVHDTPKIFGPHKSCFCKKPPRSPLLSTTSTSSSSGYSSERSSIPDVPDSPDSTKIMTTPTSYRNAFLSPMVHPPVVRTFVFPNPQVQPIQSQRRGSYTRVFNGKNNTQSKSEYRGNNQNNLQVNCPSPDCGKNLVLSQVNDHCNRHHNYQKTILARVHRSQEVLTGIVPMSLRASDILSKTSVWFGPQPFRFDDVIFYLIVDKKPDPYPDRLNEPCVSFLIQAQLPSGEANRYRYEIHLELPPQAQASHQRKHYMGWVQSLEFSCNDLLTNHRRNIVYFTQSYLRKTLQIPPFNHNLPNNSKMDIKYAIKIMRLS